MNRCLCAIADVRASDGRGNPLPGISRRGFRKRGGRSVCARYRQTTGEILTILDVVIQIIEGYDRSALSNTDDQQRKEHVFEG
jgi:hypothetical protein